MGDKLLPKEIFHNIMQRVSRLKSVADALTKMCGRYDENERYMLEGRLSRLMPASEIRSIESQQARIEEEMAVSIGTLELLATMLVQLILTERKHRPSFIPMAHENKPACNCYLSPHAVYCPMGQLAQSVKDKTDAMRQAFNKIEFGIPNTEYKQTILNTDREVTFQADTWICENHPPGSEVQVEKGEKCFCGRSQG